MLSTINKRAVKLTALAIILVSTLAATLYYMIPDNPHARSVTFALGPRSIASTGSEVYSMSNWINVTFQNGTVWESIWHLEPANFNSTDITQILLLPVPSYGGGLQFGSSPSLVTLQYAFDWNIHSSVNGENPKELGTLQVANYTFSFYSRANDYPIPYNFSVPRLNYPLHVEATGNWEIGPLLYGPWTWRIDQDRIQNIITNTTNPAEIDFDLDITVNLYYQIMITNTPTQSGYASVTWSGRWAKLQLFHDEDQLTGFRYSWTDISLGMITTP